MRVRRRVAAAGALGLAVALACAPPRTGVPVPGIESSLRPFLLDPAVDCPGGGEAATEVEAGYRELLRSADAATALRVANQAIARDSESLAPRVLSAQALLVAAQPREAADLLTPLAAAAPACLPLAIALGRAQEGAGDPSEAFATYMAVAERSAIAADAAGKLSGAAQHGTRERFSAAVAAGRREAAIWHLSRLERFWPNSEPTLVSAMEWARANGDKRGELAEVKALQALHPGQADLTLRRGQLELVVGEPRVGLALVESLAAAAPADAALQAELAQAKFAWRLLNAPEQVRGLRDKVVLTRGEFAVLLYWMVPQIRTARPGAAQIASDIVDHPSRDEIARVANLGLMSIDETLHRFSPDAGVRRSDAVAALLRLLADSGKATSCDYSRSGGRDGVCRAGVACGLIEDAVLCQAAAGVSGSEAIEMLRLALDRLED